LARGRPRLSLAFAPKPSHGHRCYVPVDGQRRAACSPRGEGAGGQAARGKARYRRRGPAARGEPRRCARCVARPLRCRLLRHWRGARRWPTLHTALLCIAPQPARRCRFRAGARARRSGSAAAPLPLRRRGAHCGSVGLTAVSPSPFSAQLARGSRRGRERRRAAVEGPGRGAYRLPRPARCGEAHSRKKFAKKGG